MINTDQAVDLFKRDYHCSQSVFVSFCEEFGISREQGFKLSKFAGAGFLWHGDFCGAITGALMIYGLKYAPGEKQDEFAEEIFFHVCHEHIRRFEKIHGSVKCRNLLGKDLSKEEELTEIRENDLFNLKCPGFVKDSAEILSQIIKETDERMLKFRSASE